MNRKLPLLLGTLLLLRNPPLFAEPSPAALAAFNIYARAVESRLAQHHRSPDNFLALPGDPATRAQLRSGQVLIEQLATPAAPSALLHHWRATAFVPNATTADFEHLLQNFSAYPQNFAPQIVSSTIICAHPPTPSSASAPASTTSSPSSSTPPATSPSPPSTPPTATASPAAPASTRSPHPASPSEHALSPSDEHGFLYRLNTYWSYEQRDGGLYLQIESISLTRSIPHGLAWAIQPYLESIPRESLVFTLTSARNALQKEQPSLTTPELTTRN